MLGSQRKKKGYQRVSTLELVHSPPHRKRLEVHTQQNMHSADPNILVSLIRRSKGFMGWGLEQRGVQNNILEAILKTPFQSKVLYHRH